MTTPTEPAKPLPSLDPAGEAVIDRIVEESLARQGLQREITDPAVLTAALLGVMAPSKQQGPAPRRPMGCSKQVKGRLARAPGR